MVNFLKALSITSLFLCLPNYIAAVAGIVNIGHTASKPGNNKKKVAKQAGFYATVLVLPSPMCEMAALAGRL